jgi:hypothetical protein
VTLVLFAPCMQRPAARRALSWLSLPWVLALSLMFTVAADSNPSRGLVSVLAARTPIY